MERVLAVLLVIVLLGFGGFYAWQVSQQQPDEEVVENNEEDFVVDDKEKSFHRLEEFAESYTADFEPFHYQNPFPVIDNIPVFDVAEADKELEPNDLVLGVEINGSARAYPIAMISQPIREVFNDHLGGAAIAATW